MFTGTLKPAAKSKAFILDISSLRFEIAGLRITPNPHKQADNHPDYLIEVRTPRGNMLRVGSMWKAKSATTGNEYFSITVTDRNGTQWRMNAVRNETTPNGEFTIVPLAGGEASPIMRGGTLELTDDGAMTGLIESYDFSMNVTLIPVAEKAKDDHPDFRIEAWSPSGKIIRIGSAWAATSQVGNDYLQLSFWSPLGETHRANAVQANDETAGTFNVIKMAEQPQSNAA